MTLKTKEKLKRMANKATFFFEDYLENKMHFWKPYRGYDIIITDSEFPENVSNEFPQKLLLRENEKDFAISHEVGHCLHFRANPRLPLIKDIRLELLMETVADYFELLYHFKRDPPVEDRTNRFNLPFLCDVNLAFNGQTVDYEFTHDVTFNELERYDTELNAIRKREGLII